jgi:hypothetical protein
MIEQILLGFWGFVLVGAALICLVQAAQRERRWRRRHRRQRR